MPMQHEVCLMAAADIYTAPRIRRAATGRHLRHCATFRLGALSHVLHAAADYADITMMPAAFDAAAQRRCRHELVAIRQTDT